MKTIPSVTFDLTPQIEANIRHLFGLLPGESAKEYHDRQNKEFEEELKAAQNKRSRRGAKRPK